MVAYITSIVAAQRLDSCGRPTVQVSLTTNKGTFQSLVPSSVSGGKYEALDLRDGVPEIFAGQGVHRATHHISHVIAPALIQKRFDVQKDLRKIDAFMCELDGTTTKSRLGANATLGISMACARAAAASAKIPLYEYLRRESGSEKIPYIMPTPFFNVLNGGAHSGSPMAFQEMMLVPVGATSVAEAMQMGAETYHYLKELITEKFGASGVGDEGGFLTPIWHPEEALDLLVAAVAKAGYKGRIKFGIDPAASEFFRSGVYNIGMKTESETGKFSPRKLAELYRDLIRKYPIVLLEDPFGEDDWASWMAFMEEGERLGRTKEPEIVGDDLTATSVERVRMAKERKACNGVLLNINQIGTISEAIAVANLAFSYGWGVFVSHRSGETTDDFIADLAVGLRAGHMKSGAPARGERVVKYNRLMDIEDDIGALGEEVHYAGEDFRSLHGETDEPIAALKELGYTPPGSPLGLPL